MKTLRVKQRKTIKKCGAVHGKQVTANQNKGGYPVFPEPTPPRIAQHGREAVIALITACVIMACVARKHPLLFSRRLPLRRGVEVAREGSGIMTLVLLHRPPR